MMMNVRNIAIGLVLTSMVMSCTRENDDVVTPISLEEYPQVLLFDDEEGGELEDSDELGIAIVLADRFDPAAEELGGVIEPLSQDFLVQFTIEDIEGIDNIADYVLEVEAVYEIDDCTDSSDEDIVLIQSYDPNTGIGTVFFPKDIEEIELIFILNEELLDNDELDGERGFIVTLTAENGAGPDNVQVLSRSFEFKVLDDELIFGDWELDLDEDDAFDNFKALFSMVNADLTDMSSDDIDEIAVEFEMAELNIDVVLTEEEEVEECGEVETDNKVIEIEAEFEELTDDDIEGDIEFIVEVELDDESVLEFVYKGSFFIEGQTLLLTLQGESDDEETDEITLKFKK